MDDEKIDVNNLGTGADADQGGADHSGADDGGSQGSDEGHDDSSAGADAGDDSGADQSGGDSDEGGDGDGEGGDGTGDGEGGASSDDGGGDGSDEGGGKQSHQKTADERVDEVLDKISEIEGNFKAYREQHENSEKPFRNVDMAIVEAKINELRAEEDALLTAGKGYQAELVRDKITDIKDAVKKNAQAKSEWEGKQGDRDSEVENGKQLQKDLDSAAKFYQQEKKIPDAVFKQSGETFVAMMKSDKIFQKQFQELAQSGRPMAAIEYAYGEVTKKMEKESKAADDAGKGKEKGKGKQMGGAGGSGKESGAGPKDYNAWMDLPAKERTAWREKNYEAYKKMQRKHIDQQV